ncbi:MAG: hypothetical protein GY822_11335 [Deltaproteobacteria bacterium]|nr:hypothetical protein [Deltaproteobacteria bacterium]
MRPIFSPKGDPSKQQKVASFSREIRSTFLIFLVFLMVTSLNVLASENRGDLSISDEDSQKGAGQALLEQNLLDPKGEFWIPRRGPRLEVSFFGGAESSFADITGLENLPQPTGTSWTVAGNFYPVDRLALSLHLKGFFGLDAPAAGTSAATVVSMLTGVRWDLVSENRFSVLVDVFSGPALFAFAEIVDVIGELSPATWALGAEVGAAITFRYSLGPFTGEFRVLSGFRAGSASDIGRPRGEIGPFSAIYAGADLGITWSFLDNLKLRGRRK